MKSTTATQLPKPTKRGFITWVRSQPALANWDYFNHSKCPFACYLKSLGIKSPYVGGSTWRATARSKPHHIPTDVAFALSACSAIITREELLGKFRKA